MPVARHYPELESFQQGLSECSHLLKPRCVHLVRQAAAAAISILVDHHAEPTQRRHEKLLQLRNHPWTQHTRRRCLQQQLHPRGQVAAPV